MPNAIPPAGNEGPESEEHEEEEYEDGINELSGDLKEDLLTYLDQITSTGHFATMRKLDTIVDPQVRLVETENTPGHDVAIPLGSKDALKLIEAAHQAPFGKGEKTIIDTSVRNT